MALNRKQLQEKLESMTPETVMSTLEWILSGHSATVEALKEERDTYKEQAGTAADIAKERDGLKAQLEKAGDAAAIRKEYDEYKAGVERKELNARKARALTSAFETAGVKRESFRNAMLKAWDLDSVELDESGAIKNADGITAAVQKDYADFVATAEDKPVPPNTPPTGNGKGKDPFEMGFDE